MQLYINTNSVNLLEKKILNENFYSKYFIRALIFKKSFKQASAIIDSNSIFYTICPKLKYFRKTFLKTQKLHIGSSVILNKFLYNNKNIPISFSLYSFHSKNTPFIQFYLEKLNSLRSKKKSFLIIRIKKGGFTCIFNGIKGFLPRSHGILLIKQTKIILKKTHLKVDTILINNYCKHKNFQQIKNLNKNLKSVTDLLNANFVNKLYLYKILILFLKKKQLLKSNFKDLIFLLNYTNSSKKLCYLEKLSTLTSLIPNQTLFSSTKFYKFIYFNFKLFTKRIYSKTKIFVIRKKRKVLKRFTGKFVFLAFIKK